MTLELDKFEGEDPCPLEELSSGCKEALKAGRLLL